MIYICSNTLWIKIEPNDKNHLVVDEDVRHVVKLIFNMCFIRKGEPTIENVLEEQRIFNPTAYKTLKGSTRFAKLQETNHCKCKVVYLLNMVVMN